jgi:UDP-N-acetylglucosamine 4,6-dehydratase
MSASDSSSERDALRFADDKSVVVTGGTGSFGQAFVAALLRSSGVRRVLVLSRDELKQHEMRQRHPNAERLELRIGDVRDASSLRRAVRGADLVVHAAALKQIGTGERSPFEVVQTNVLGAQNVIEAALEQGVTQVVAISTDKASSPINAYGATKLLGDKLFVAANGEARTAFSVVRYGNVMGSRGSVVGVYERLASTGTIPITDPRMTRFWITLPQTVRFVSRCFTSMAGGEIFVPKLPSVKLLDIAEAIAPECEHDIIGIRRGEKLHEELVSAADARCALESEDRIVVFPSPKERARAGEAFGTPLPDGFAYRSDQNSRWLNAAQIRALLD